MKGIRKILIAGGTGFLGRALEKFFLKKGDEVYILTRNPQKKNEVYWDAKELGEWVDYIEWANVLINLTGKSVDCRYTEKNRSEIRSSRIESTQVLAKAIKVAKQKPEVWLNSSSATIYVHAETQKMTEDTGVIGDDFSMNVCKDWENTFFRDQLSQTRRVALRTSIVLGKNGGAYPVLRKLTRWFLGGTQGNGKQFLSWIHIEDFCKAVNFIVNNQQIVGPINVVNPKAVSNEKFMKLMRKSLKRPFGINQPKWLLELGAKVVKTETELLLKSRNVFPERLLDLGFKFDYNAVDYSLKNLAG